jgi:quercetin 2,3-dioxygenase
MHIVSYKNKFAEANMIERRLFNELGGADYDWLKTKYHFSFANYHNLQRMGIGALRVWNDDEIAPHSGFPLHAHSDMEIITYVLKGAITHEDDQGNQGRTEAGDIQVMSAGYGIRHAEYNRENIPTQLFQIWIETNERGSKPFWHTKPFPRNSRTGCLATLASGFASDKEALPIRADARVLGAVLTTGESIEYPLEPDYNGYLVPTTGIVDINGVSIETRDGAAIKHETILKITALKNAEFILVIA